MQNGMSSTLDCFQIFSTYGSNLGTSLLCFEIEQAVTLQYPIKISTERILCWLLSIMQIKHGWTWKTGRPQQVKEITGYQVFSTYLFLLHTFGSLKCIPFYQYAKYDFSQFDFEFMWQKEKAISLHVFWLKGTGYIWTKK